MIGSLLRTLPVVVRARLARDRSLVSRLQRRVPLRHVDVNHHMNQAAYAEVFEAGRLDWVLRTRAWDAWRRVGVHPLVAEQRLVYRRELKPWARFEVDTRAVGIDGRLLTFESYAHARGRVHALGEAKIIFVGPDGVLAPEEVPPLVSAWVTAPLGVEDWHLTGIDPSHLGNR